MIYALLYLFIGTALFYLIKFIQVKIYKQPFYPVEGEGLVVIVWPIAVFVGCALLCVFGPIFLIEKLLK